MTNPQHEFNFITTQKKVDRVDINSAHWKKYKEELLRKGKIKWI
tara:strand:+ start:448 stop:579 length:132 start_codon:yes stop_codon:yes gene_type:complete